MSTANPDLRKNYKQEFTNKVSDLLAPNHFKGTALARFILHHISKWKLTHVDPYGDVLLEGIKRVHEYIEKTGQPIKVPEAFLRKICLNILRDKVKETIKNEKLIERSIIDYEVSNRQTRNPLAEAELFEQIEKLDEAFQQLSEGERLIIRLRFYEGKTYEQIQYYYEILEGNKSELAALRKRESRALKRLKNKFLKLYNQSTSIVIPIGGGKKDE